ncbi:unnamed protein product [Choristocarpus tenellus]
MAKRKGKQEGKMKDGTGSSETDKRAMLEELLRSGADPSVLRAAVAKMSDKDRKAMASSMTSQSQPKTIPRVPIPTSTGRGDRAKDAAKGNEMDEGESGVACLQSPSARPASKRRRLSSGPENSTKSPLTRAQPNWEVATDWDFSTDVLKGVPFAKELWLMMAVFGDPRGDFVCICSARGEKVCPCLETVVTVEKIIRKFAMDLIGVCREWSGGLAFGTKHLHEALPGEMREYMGWKEARRSTVSSTEEKVAMGKNPSRGGGKGQNNSTGDLDDDDDEYLEAGEQDLGSEKELGEGDDLLPEIQDAADRMDYRKRLADKRTVDMDDATYLGLFSEWRKAFFLRKRARGTTRPGSVAYLEQWLGLRNGGKLVVPTSRLTLHALGFLLYDRVGNLMEKAIQARNGGRLAPLTEGKCSP